jgi:hypothetical protein
MPANAAPSMTKSPKFTDLGINVKPKRRFAPK